VKYVMSAGGECAMDELSDKAKYQKPTPESDKPEYELLQAQKYGGKYWALKYIRPTEEPYDDERF
jgi:hypothetical protein